MPISSADKKETAKTWIKAFPTLCAYAQDKLYKVVGPFIMGIEIIKLPRVDEYRPHFVLYPLYGNSSGSDLKACMTYPVLLFEFFNKKNLQYSIAYKNSLSILQEVFTDVKNQLAFNIDGEIDVTSFYKLIDTQINNGLVKKQLKEPEYYEVKYYSALYLSSKEAEVILEQIQKDSKSWDMNRFSAYYGDFENWLNDLKKVKRSKFISVIEKNKSDKRIAKLQQSELKI
ncbi:MAG: hypothetical protein ABJF04_21245 [Reichenbachiella sp.]|uniref:hypothetical protein n=1 Tax=Reichenbachiella sp. TaxID=2184521 RepID=UPI0032672335